MAEPPASLGAPSPARRDVWITWMVSGYLVFGAVYVAYRLGLIGT